MKNWMKVWISVLFVAVFSALTVSAKDSGNAILHQVEGTQDLSVTIELAEGMTENITSLHFEMYVSLESGTMSAEPSFDFSSLIKEHMTVYSASVSWDAQNSDYIVDVVVAGSRQETIFFLDGVPDGKALIGTLNLPEEDYYAEVGFVESEDVGDVLAETESAEYAPPTLQYVDRGGVEAMSVRLTNAEPVFVGHKPQPETEPEPVEPQPETQTESEGESLPTTPIPSGPVIPDGEQPDVQEQPEPETEPQPETAPKPETEPETELETEADAETEMETGPETEPETEARPALRPAEPAKNGLEAPDLTVRALTGTKTLEFSWDHVEDADGYRIYKYNEETGKYKKYKNIKDPSVTPFTADFSFGELCRFRMRAYRKEDGSRLYGAYSAEREVTVSAFNMAKKVRVRVSAGSQDRQLRFKWNRVSGADGYQILSYNAGTERFKVMKTIRDGEAQQFNGGNYNYATTYQFAMRAFAYDEDGNKVFGAQGAEVSFTTRPARVKNLQAESLEESGVSLTWKKVSRADGYMIYRSLANKKDIMKRVAVIEDNAIRQYVDRNLESGSTYYYQVVAYKTLPGGKRKPGNRSKMKSVEVQ